MLVALTLALDADCGRASGVATRVLGRGEEGTYQLAPLQDRRDHRS